MAVEDERFYEHHGIDYQAVVRAMVLNVQAGTVVQGGSTITEQYVKNAYVGDERTYQRKLREAVLAWQLEDRWTKDRILTAYLNTVYYGAGAYGVEAAARTYFHKHASGAQPQGGGDARGDAQVPLRLLAHHRPRDGQAAARQGAAAHGRPGLHHAGARRQADGDQAAASTSTRRTTTRAWPTTSSTTSPASSPRSSARPPCSTAASRSSPASTSSGSRRRSTSSSRPPGRSTSASSPPPRSSPSTPPTATSAPWSAASTTRSRSSTSPGRPSGSRARR